MSELQTLMALFGFQTPTAIARIIEGTSETGDQVTAAALRARESQP